MSPTDAAACTALVPLRAGGKTRLAPALDVGQRDVLARAMLTDVVAALRGAGVGRIVAVVGGGRARAAASRLGLDVVVDGCDTAGIDAALRDAQARLGPLGASLVVPADLPCLTPQDVETVLAADADVVVAPTHDGGTGGLMRRPGSVIPAAYGRDSARRHVRAALEAGARCRVLRLEGFARDVDTVADLDAFDHAVVGPASRRALRSLRAPAR